MDAFLELFAGLERLGPGSASSTRRALGALGDLPAEPRVVDFGCGMGLSSMALAESAGARVTAVDLHQPFLDALESEAARRGLSERITTRCISMDELDAEPGSYDVVWSEGAAYLINFEYALNVWAPLLPKGGKIAVSEATWLTNTRPIEAMRFWADAYPDMQDVKGNLKALRRQGFEPIEHFTLPAEDWTAEYYDRLRANIERLRPQAETSEELAEAIDATSREIELFEAHGDSYGYVFYTARKVA